MRRAAPAVALFFIAPLVAEFLLGDLPISFLGTLVILAPMYGGGALLIREVVRRTGRGWTSIIVLALAYGILEEAFLTETLFNPNYLGLNLHLLEPAYIPRLGIGIWWTVFVLTLHTVWSISVSIGLAEALVPKRATTPWLGSVGVTITAVLFALAAIASANYAIKSDKQHFIASAPQFTWAGIACALVIVIAFLLPKPRAPRASGFVPSPWVVGLAALAAGSFFLVVPKGWGWNAVVIYLALDVIVIAAFGRWSRRLNWNDFHRLALAGGAGLAYAWHAFIQNPAAGQAGKVDRIGNAVFAVALIAVLLIAANRISRAFTERGIAAGSPAS